MHQHKTTNKMNRKQEDSTKTEAWSNDLAGNKSKEMKPQQNQETKLEDRRTAGSRMDRLSDIPSSFPATFAFQPTFHSELSPFPDDEKHSMWITDIGMQWHYTSPPASKLQAQRKRMPFLPSFFLLSPPKHSFVHGWMHSEVTTPTHQSKEPGNGKEQSLIDWIGAGSRRKACKLVLHENSINYKEQDIAPSQHQADASLTSCFFFISNALTSKACCRLRSRSWHKKDILSGLGKDMLANWFWRRCMPLGCFFVPKYPTVSTFFGSSLNSLHINYILCHFQREHCSLQ